MRLLIAEDDPALGRFLARGMEQDGHQVILALARNLEAEGKVILKLEQGDDFIA
jgi:DNA-binding response OmpR family regulator